MRYSMVAMVAMVAFGECGGIVSRSVGHAAIEHRPAARAAADDSPFVTLAASCPRHILEARLHKGFQLS
jgi:hypothetical protein